MLKRLQKKWKVGPGRLVLILISFAVGGSLSGWVARRVHAYAEPESPWLSIPLYILIVTILWPFCVLLASLPFGQFLFFKDYINRLVRKITWKS